MLELIVRAYCKTSVLKIPLHPIGFCAALSLQIQKHFNKALDDLASSLSFLKNGKAYVKTLPAQGLSQPEVIQKMKEYSSLGMAESIYIYIYMLVPENWFF